MDFIFAGIINSQLNSFNPMQAMGQAVSMQDPAAQQQISELQNLDRSFNETKSKLDSISNELTNLMRSGDKEVIDKLELAMGKVYKLAIFIRGDYDDRDHDDADTENKNALTAAAVAAFKEIDDLSERILADIGRKHAEVMEMENTIILPGKQKVELLQSQVENEVASLNNQLSEIDSTISNMQNSISQQQNAIGSLQEKIEETRNAKLASDIGFSILTFGIGNLINDGPLDPANLGGQLRDTENALESTRRALNDAVARQFQLAQQKASLAQRANVVQMAKAMFPGLLSNSQTTNSKCVMLQGQFGPLKETASRLVSKIDEVEQGAVVTEALAYSKKEFAAGLLEICGDSLLDSALTDEAKLVKDEIINEYGGQIPDDIAEAASGVDEKIQLITGMPSIRAF